MSLGQSMMNWLRSVDKDQNLQGLANLTSTSMSDRVRRWFRRQDLTPTLPTGYYDTIAEQYALGVVEDRADTTAFSAVSAQDTDFVITSGQRWEIKMFTGFNGTQASYVQTWYYDGTNEYPLFLNGAAVSNNLGYAGGQGNVINLLGNGTIALRMSLSAYAAGNTVRSMLVYRRIS